MTNEEMYDEMRLDMTTKFDRPSQANLNGQEVRPDYVPSTGLPVQRLGKSGSLPDFVQAYVATDQN